jgi:hypothetical protein
MFRPVVDNPYLHLEEDEMDRDEDGKGFHSSTSQLNLSPLCHHNYPTCPTNSAYVTPKSGRV